MVIDSVTTARGELGCLLYEHPGSQSLCPGQRVCFVSHTLTLNFLFQVNRLTTPLYRHIISFTVIPLK